MSGLERCGAREPGSRNFHKEAFRNHRPGDGRRRSERNGKPTSNKPWEEVTHPIHLDEVGAKYPDLKIIAAHFGNPWTDELLVLCQRRPSICTDISSTAQTMLTYNPLKFIQDLRVAVSMFPRKVMFGSDWPLLKPAMDQKTLVTKMQQLTVPDFLREPGYMNFTAGDKDQIMFKNAKTLLSL